MTDNRHSDFSLDKNSAKSFLTIDTLKQKSLSSKITYLKKYQQTPKDKDLFENENHCDYDCLLGKRNISTIYTVIKKTNSQGRANQRQI